MIGWALANTARLALQLTLHLWQQVKKVGVLSPDFRPTARALGLAGAPMAQESRHPFRLLGPGKKRLNKNGLREPFLSPGGSVHTTEAIEKSKLPARWLVLLLLSVLMIGNYYCYDNPAALYSMLAAKFSSAEHFDFCDRLPSNPAHRVALRSAAADAAPASHSSARLRRPVLGVLVAQHRAAARRRHARRPVGRRQVALPLHAPHPARTGHLRRSMQVRHPSPAPLPCIPPRPATLLSSLCPATHKCSLTATPRPRRRSAGWPNGMLLGRTVFGLGGESLPVF